jgi:hypothetical protein
MRRSKLWARVNRLRTGEDGFTLVELIVAGAALGVGGLAVALLS